MTRGSRVLSNSGIYHIMLRGNEKKDIFHDGLEKKRFLEGLAAKQNEMAFSVYAYCLMNNHVHLLLDMHNHDLSKVMSGVSVRYATFYNWKHERVGHVFQDRFRSEPIEDDRYLLAVIRYIHNNPVKAGLVENPEGYQWSSYRSYIGDQELVFLDTSFVLNMFSNDKTIAIRDFREFSNKMEDTFFPASGIGTEIRTLDDGKTYLERFLQKQAPPIEIKDLGKDKRLRQEVILHLKNHTDLSQRAIAILVGVDKGVVERAISK